MSSTVLYDALVRFLWLVTRVFFRQVEVTGDEHVPRDGAVMFCGNHPNSLIDPVLITTSCGRRVAFAAKDVLFESVLLRVFLRILGAVPIKRKQDHKEEGTLDNSDAFSALFDVLKRGGAFGIFPEGISHSRSELAPLKTGAARIALGAAAEGATVRIVPCGLSYHRRERMRGRVLVSFGAPIEVTDDDLARWREDPRAASHTLTELIDRRLRALTINAPDFDTLRVLEGCRRLYKPRDKKLTLAERAEVSRRFLDHYDRVKDVPEVAATFDDVATYMFQLEALGLTDRVLLQPLSRRAHLLRVLKHFGLLFVLAPLALPGILVHLPVIILAVFAGEALTSRKDVKATTKMITATGLTLMIYVVIGLAVLVLVKLPAALWVAPLCFVSLLASGWATIKVLERQSALRHGVRVLMTLLDLKREIMRLREERERLREHILELVDRYIDPDLERIVDNREQAAD